MTLAAFAKLRNGSESTKHARSGLGRRTHLVQLNAVTRQVCSPFLAALIPGFPGSLVQYMQEPSLAAQVSAWAWKNRNVGSLARQRRCHA